MLTLSQRCLLVGLLCSLVAVGPGSPAPSPISSQLDALVAASLDPAGPGVAVGVAHHGVVVYQASRGMADLARALPIIPDTRFDLASVSKQFTAMAILVLAAEGALALGDEASIYLPELAPVWSKRPVRVADLLAMHSGLTDYLDVVGSDEELRSWRNETVLAIASTQPRASAPGIRYEYSNTNYVLLAIIVERVSGQSFADFVRTAIFEPLGMADSTVLDVPGTPVPNRARGYARSPGGPHPSECDTGVVGDGQVFTTVGDLLIWDAALRRGALIGPAATAHLFTPTPLDSGLRTEYAMGYYVSEPPGHHLAEHGGGWYGTSTWMGRYLDDELTVIVLSNDENRDARALGVQVAAIVLGADVTEQLTRPE